MGLCTPPATLRSPAGRPVPESGPRRPATVDQVLRRLKGQEMCVETTAAGTAPGSGTAACRKVFRVSQAQRLSSTSSLRSCRKKRRRILGMEKTQCLCGTALSTCPQSHSPNSTARFCPQLGQNFLSLQEKDWATNYTRCVRVERKDPHHAPLSPSLFQAVRSGRLPS